MTDNLSSEELRELARTLPPGPAARSVLNSACFPAEHIPASSGLASIEFWELIGAALTAGLVPSGRRRLIDAAHSRFPANRVFGAAAPVTEILLVGASPQGRERVRADREFREVQAATEHTDLKVHSCPAADLTDLRKVLSLRPDVLHLACHGADGVLIFEYASGREHRVSVATVVDVLGTYREHAGARLRGIVLGSCSGADIAGLFTAVADTVVAHDGDLDDDCAVTFAGELYRCLPHVDGLGAAARIAARHVAAVRHACRAMPDALVVLEAAAEG